MKKSIFKQIGLLMLTLSLGGCASDLYPFASLLADVAIYEHDDNLRYKRREARDRYEGAENHHDESHSHH